MCQNEEKSPKKQSSTGGFVSSIPNILQFGRNMLPGNWYRKNTLLDELVSPRFRSSRFGAVKPFAVFNYRQEVAVWKPTTHAFPLSGTC